MAKREVSVGPYEANEGDFVVSFDNGRGWVLPVRSTVVDIADSRSNEHRSFVFENGLTLGIDTDIWTVTVERDLKLATYYFRTHESQTTYLYTSGRLFDNASVVVDEDGVVHKAVFDG